MPNNLFIKVRDLIYLTIAFCIGGYVEFVVPDIFRLQLLYQAMTIFSMMSLMYVLVNYLYSEDAPDLIRNRGPLFFWMYFFIAVPLYYAAAIIRLTFGEAMEEVAFLVFRFGNSVILILCYSLAVWLLFTKKGEELDSQFEQSNGA